ncbi:unnamed protein product, partial [Rotaria sp. Silwood2]
MFSEQVNENNAPQKWWHRRWFTILCICFIGVAMLAVILTLVLKFAILVPKKQDITTATLSSSTATATPPIATTTSSTAMTTSPTATTPLTTTATTTQQS